MMARQAEPLSVDSKQTIPRLERRSDPAVSLPLSYAQQSLWFMDQLVPDHPFYNLSSALRLTGPFDLEAMRLTFAALVDRHEALRTVFPSRDGRPVQQVLRSQSVEVPLIRAHGADLEQRRAYALKLAVAEGQRPFDLHNGPLLRAAVFEIDPTEHLLVFFMHHIVADGWSIGVMSREIPDFYDAFRHGREPELPALEIQYGDYALWQRDWIAAGGLDEGIDHWCRRLQGIRDLELPVDRARPAIQSHRGAVQLIEIPSGMSAGLESLAEAEGASLFMVLLTAFHALLGRYSGQEQTLVGTPMANRETREVEGLLGFFANSLVLPCDLRGNPSFRRLLGRVRQETLDAFHHRQVPFELLVEKLQVERDPGRNPLFQVMFALQKSSVAEMVFPGLQAEVVDLQNNTTHFDMEWHLWHRNGGIDGYISYNVDLFEPTTMLRFVSHYILLLEGALKDPDRTIHTLNILPAWEHEWLAQRSTGGAGDRSVEEGAANLDGNLAHTVASHEPVRMTAALSARLESSVPVMIELAPEAGAWSARQIFGMAEEMRAAWAGRLQAGERVLWQADGSPESLGSALALWALGVELVLVEPGEPQGVLVHLAHELGARRLVAGPGGEGEEDLPSGLSRLPAPALPPRSKQAEAQLSNVLSDLTADVSGDAVALWWPLGHGRAPITHRDLIERSTRAVEAYGTQAGETFAILGLRPSAAFLESLACLVGGASVLVSSATPDDSVEELSAAKPSSLLLTPDMVHQLHSQELVNGFGRLILTGALPVPSLLETFHRRFGKDLCFVYSPPEALGPLARREGRRADDTRGLVLDDVPDGSLAVLDESGCPAPIGVVGRIYLEESLCLEKGEGRSWVATGDLGRRLMSGRVELWGPADGALWWQGERLDLGALGAALADGITAGSPPEVRVVARRSPRAWEPVVVLEPPRTMSSCRLRAESARAIGPSCRLEHWHLVGRMPLDPAGNLHTAALDRRPLLDTSVAERWQHALHAQPGVRQARVLLRPREDVEGRLHLSDVLPDWKADRESPPHRIESESLTAEERDSRPLAIALGEPLTLPEGAPRTLDEALRRTAEAYPDRGLLCLQESGEETFLSYPELLDQALRVLSGLRAAGLKPGDRVILQCLTLSDHFACFWACVLGGVVPVTVAIPTSYDQPGSVVSKLWNTWRLLGGPWILHTAGLGEGLAGVPALFADQDPPPFVYRMLRAESLRRHEPAQTTHPCRPDDVVFYQLTSGSTGVPKCIQETHDGIIHHIHGSARFNAYSAQDVTLNWLPMDHVVPILTCHLKDTYLGLKQIHVRPPLILAAPLRWLDLMDEHRVTHTWSPNFGFKLVADALAENPSGSWDLSCLKFAMNAGEQVTLPVVRQWLQRLSAFGVEPHVMQPAFGMAEVCTCMTYCNDFSLEDRVHWIDKSSLGGLLQKAEPGSKQSQAFIDLGPVMPGVDIRITDASNQVLPEGVIGRFQIRGAVTTPGYLDNDEANREAFVGDGWFNSGDLGFIQEGRLTLTGREKEIIIIRGANFYCYEIEDSVGAIAGVLPTFSAAIAVEDPATGSETLAVFYVPENDVSEDDTPEKGGPESTAARESAGPDELDVELIQRIRESIGRELGISPGWVVPLQQAEFPKTTSGKIQRNQLKKALAAGAFDALLRRIDLALGQAHTIPAWFYRRTWSPKALPVSRRHDPATVSELILLLDDGGDTADALARRCTDVIRVRAAATFSDLGNNCFEIDPDEAESYRCLWQALAAAKRIPDRVVDFWQGSPIQATESREEVDRPGDMPGDMLCRRLERVLHGIQAYREVISLQGSTADRRLTLLGIASSSVRTQEGESPMPARAALQAWLKTANQEIPQLNARHIDLDVADAETQAGRLVAELQSHVSDQVVAYRQRRRLVPTLEAVDFEKDREKEPDFTLCEGGFYVVTGGLGGLGRRLTAFLASHLQARVLLLGRSAVEASSTDDKSVALAELRQLGDVRYEPVDIGDPQALSTALETCRDWGLPSGVFHLAGTFRTASLDTLNRQDLRQDLWAKVEGTSALRAAFPHPCPFVAFGSVNSFFGGAMAGAYAVGNRYLEAFVEAERGRGQKSAQYLAWSMWEELGMSRGYLLKEASRAQGFVGISAERGIWSLRAVVGRGGGTYVGLDPSRARVRSHVQGAESSLTEMVGFYSAASDFDAAALENVQVPDLFGTATTCRFIHLEHLPTAPDGSIDEARLLHRRADGPEPALGARTSSERLVASIWKDVLGIDTIDVQRSFFELGGQSLLLVRAHYKLSQAVGRHLTVVDLLRHPTVASLARFLDQQDVVKPTYQASVERARRQRGGHRRPSEDELEAETVSIIGMAGRFPQAPDIDAFWRNLVQGRECVSFFSDEELAAAGVGPMARESPNFVPARAVLEDVDLFDAGFFGFNPREAEATDPQHRLLLETAWQALESAGYDPARYTGLIGVFAGADANSYAVTNLLLGTDGLQTLIGNDKDYLASRIAYKLNLKGPALTVQTACSTSLVAVHQACRSLLAFDSDLVLAGGAGVYFPQKGGYFFEEGGILSPDGHCRAFDAEAKGTVGGDGVGMVVLKRTSEALADGDNILAVIKGSACNNDGSNKVGFTAPSAQGQAEVIALAHAVAGVDAGSLGYVETHGTGTQLGDPIEMSALTDVFHAAGAAVGGCAVGSLKTNVGHMNSAAGVGSLIKTVLILGHGRIPPSLHFKNPNPRIDFAGSPFYVNAKLTEWPSQGVPRRAGVSSFGIGGTNAHMVLEQAPLPGQEPEAEKGSAAPRLQLLPLSARSHHALTRAADRLADWLEENPEAELADVAYTLQVGRHRFAHRRWVVADTTSAAVAALRRGGGELTREPKTRQAMFLFPGQGSQYSAMGRRLYAEEPVFRAAIDRAAELIEPLLGDDIRELMFGRPTAGTLRAEDAADLSETRITQPALFVFEWALATWWRSLGVEPVAMLGHSVGEYVAACLAGVFSLEQGLMLIVERGRLIQEQPRGAMLAVALTEEQAQALPGVTTAAINGPRSCVVAGSEEAIAALEKDLAARGDVGRRLRTSHAFHSPLIAGMAEPFRACLEKVPLKPPQIPFISNVTGTWITAQQAVDVDYWLEHCLRPVRFADGLVEATRDRDPVLLEVGPGHTLTRLVGKQGAALRELPTVAGVRDSPQSPTGRSEDGQTGDEHRALLDAVGDVAAAGIELEWQALHVTRRRRVALPTYPFERERFFIDPQEKLRQVFEAKAVLGKIEDPDAWLFVPGWRRATPRGCRRHADAARQSLKMSDERAEVVTPREDTLQGDIVVFAHRDSVDSAVIERLQERLAGHGGRLVRVEPGDRYERFDDLHFGLDPMGFESYRRLLTELIGHGLAPRHVVHLWQCRPGSQAMDVASFEKAQVLGFYSLLYLTQALGQADLAQPVTIHVVGQGLVEVTGEEKLCPERTTCLGLATAVSQEYTHLSCRILDLELDDEPRRSCLDSLTNEIFAPVDAGVVAIRGRHRWIASYDPMPAADVANLPLKEGGTYLITGGLGEIGMIFAEYLARTYAANLVLTGRRGVPARDDWDAWLASHGRQEELSRRIRQVRHLESLGAEVLTLSADVGDREQMQEVLSRAQASFGRIDGVIHAAGHVGHELFRPVSDASLDQCRLHFRPKAHGLITLADVLPTDLDFCLLTSSLAAVLGGLGSAAYAAANTFMDAFCHARSQEPGGPRWSSVNWDAWVPQDGAASSPATTHPATAWTRFAIKPQEGVAVLEKVLAFSAPQVVVSTTDLSVRLRQLALAERVKQGETPAEDTSRARHARPEQDNEYVAPRTDLEAMLAEMWQTLLGIDKVGVTDNFFRLGGDSLIAIQLGTRLQEAVGIQLNINQLFDEPTIAGLAERLEAVQTDPGLPPIKAEEPLVAVGQPSDLLATVENLSDEDVLQMLAELEGVG